MKLPFSKDSLHHAYIITGEHTVVTPLLRMFIENELGMTIAANPDIRFEEIETLSIDDSRRIKHLHEVKSFDATGKRVTVISMNGATVEAQNSLLKIFEEPIEGSHFFIIVPSLHIVLPTLRSRALHIDLREEHRKDDEHLFSALVSKFIDPKNTLKDRLDIAAQIAKDISDEKATRSDAKAFVVAIIRALSGTRAAQRTLSENKILKLLLETESYISDRSSSVKLLLENIAISLYN